MNPSDPIDAQQVVVEYARVLERDLAGNRHPNRVDALPFAKPVIKTALETCTREVTAAGQLTDELRDFLETAYISLAEYLDAELVDLMAQFRASAEELAVQPHAAREKTQSVAWRTVAETSALAGDIARAMAAEAEALRREFQRLMAAG